jgi:uncharacterized Zn-finger protein
MNNLFIRFCQCSKTNRVFSCRMSNVWNCSEFGCDKSFANVNSLRRHVLLSHHKKYRKNGSALPLEGQHLECRLQAARNSR